MHTLTSAPLEAPTAAAAAQRRRRPVPTPAVTQLAWTCDSSRVNAIF